MSTDIAEIIGWEERYEYWNDGDTMCAGYLTYGPDGKRRYAQRGPTADDLLAWLRERRFASFHFGVEADGFYVDWGDDAAHAPTLLAALEAAVRAVHDAEEAK